MFLTLEVISSHAASLGAASRRTFGPEGGGIGRDTRSDWTLPHGKVSSLHARITCVTGTFYIEDRSTNGVYRGPARERLPRGLPQPLRPGDRLFIEPYEIQVAAIADAPAARPNALIDPALERAPLLDDDPFATDSPFPAPRSGRAPAMPAPVRADEVDPLKLLDPGSAATPARRAGRTPTAEDLDRASPLAAHYQPPPVGPSSPAPGPARAPFEIPPDYDPLATESRIASVPSRAAPTPTPAPTTPPAVRSATPPPARDERQVIESEVELPAPAAVDARAPSAPTPSPSAQPTSDLAEVLAGAGLDTVEVTPELARDFGRILRIVVSGVMDVLRARQQIKDEFRMRMTQFKPADNNPLKFSANVEDALHNLLIKRNAAYLDPVDAFEDAFEDVRSHQIAMLAGMRTGFDAMLAHFGPDRLQEQLDRQIKRGALINVPARLRYWELYREHAEELLRDPETTFRRLFGEEFAKAYEEQLARLKAERRGHRSGGSDS